jgi:phospholipid transport system substrate-binding protein
MRIRHAVGLGALCALGLVAAFSIQANDSSFPIIGFESKAKRFVAGTLNTAAQLATKYRGKQKALARKRSRQRIGRLVARRVETRSLARFVLGPYGRRASKAQRRRFETALRSYLTGLLAGEIGAFANRRLTVNEVVHTGAREGDVLVLSRISDKGGLPLRVDWRVRPTRAGPKLVDVIVEGLSLAVAQRAEFMGLLRRNGGKIDMLIAHLEGRRPAATAAKAPGAKTDQRLVGVATSN